MACKNIKPKFQFQNLENLFKIFKKIIVERETYGKGLVVGAALQVVRQLVERQVRSVRSIHEPPGSSTNGGATDVGTDGHVTEEEPASDQRLVRATGRLVHDVQVGGVEAQGSGGKTVSDQVDPQELDGDQSFGQTQGSSQEDGDDLSTFL